MANTKKSPCKGECKWGNDDGGQAHKNCQLNQWSEESMAAAITEYNHLCGQLGLGNVLISSVANRYKIPATTFWKK